jgi:short-subunit dehydrogenase
MTEEQLHATFNINTISHWFTVQQFLPWMIQQNKGHVVTIASGASFLSVPKGSDYAGSKSSARAFHETLGTELKYFYKAPKVLTTSVHPEFVRTPIIKDFEAHLDQEGTLILSADVVADRIVARILSRRGGTLVLPENHSIVTGFRGWPGWMQEIVRDKMGARSARRK